MAESNFSPPLRNSFSMPTPPAPNTPGQGTSSAAMFPPGYANYHSMAYERSGYNPLHTNYLPEPSRAQVQYSQQNRPFHYQLPEHGDPRAAGYYSPPPFHNGPHAGMPHTLPPMPFQRSHVPGNPTPDFPEFRNNNYWMPMIEPQISSGGQAYNFQPYPPPLYGFDIYPGQRSDPTMADPPPPSAGHLVHYGAGRPEVPNPFHQLRSTFRGAGYERQHEHHSQIPGNPDRRSLSALDAQGRRSDRSVSPRTSNNRRSFDRYSTDLSHTSTSSDAEETAARTRLHRGYQSRRRWGNADFRSRGPGAGDGNTPTTSQMQEFKHKLRRLLPTELPENASTTCDICQKDYSAKSVPPTEEDEVAVQLSCKHVFGEHCINTWFDTCRTHKNKITCPMCRVVLIESCRPSPPFRNTGEMIAFISSARSGALDLSAQQEFEQFGFASDIQVWLSAYLLCGSNPRRSRSDYGWSTGLRPFNNYLRREWVARKTAELGVNAVSQRP
ncbi:hypothetical protein BDV95DRAFT_605639 [Massariosphaeria phaeospora]|uniref:RING-type domain-containing protein n=1 Tax=Massariosphaeria phaeospora TaxID=100035 RepID=A0A7C8IBM0_9PLEO|nr:hypothetical protein BDV95DRAFT_605639 [Massariosphaeria phaeospora]